MSGDSEGPGQSLLEALRELAGTFRHEGRVSEVMGVLAEQAARVLGVAGASVCLVRNDSLRVEYVSAPELVGLGRAGCEDPDSPASEAVRSGRVIAIGSLGREAGPLRFATAAAAAGIAAMAAVPMRSNSHSLGVLCLYSAERRVWSAAELDSASVLADSAAGYVVKGLELDEERRAGDQLEEALHSRIVIEQAKGVLAAHHGISIDEAWELLRRHANDHRADIHVVAGAVVNLGLRPGPRPRRMDP